MGISFCCSEQMVVRELDNSIPFFGSMERLDQGHLHPLLEASKEIFEQLVNSYSGTST